MHEQGKSTIADIVAELNPAVVSSAMVRIERHFKRQREQDCEFLDSLRRILESPNPQAQRLRQLIKEVVNA
jgi:hypothetical protein